MKKLFIVLALGSFLFACGSEPAVSAEEAEVQDVADSVDAVDAFEQLEQEIEAENSTTEEDGTEMMPNDAPESN